MCVIINVVLLVSIVLHFCTINVFVVVVPSVYSSFVFNVSLSAFAFKCRCDRISIKRQCQSNSYFLLVQRASSAAATRPTCNMCARATRRASSTASTATAASTVASRSASRSACPRTPSSSAACPRSRRPRWPASSRPRISRTWPSTPVPTPRSPLLLRPRPPPSPAQQTIRPTSAVASRRAAPA